MPSFFACVAREFSPGSIDAVLDIAVDLDVLAKYDDIIHIYVVVNLQFRSYCFLTCFPFFQCGFQPDLTRDDSQRGDGRPC